MPGGVIPCKRYGDPEFCYHLRLSTSCFRYGAIIAEINLRASFFQCIFSFESRAVNYEAHSLAKFFLSRGLVLLTTRDVSCFMRTLLNKLGFSKKKKNPLAGSPSPSPCSASGAASSRTCSPLPSP